MCDEFTTADDDAQLAARGLTRRGFAGLAATATLVAGNAALLARNAAFGAGAVRGGPDHGGPDHGGLGLSESLVEIPTPDGSADAFFVHPAVEQKHPGILLWPDIAGLRDAYKVMARRLAADGYAVLVVNPYYRTARAPLLASFAEYATPAGQARIKPAQGAITPAGTARDAAAFVHFLDRQKPVARGRGIGTVGYCMGGGAAVRTAAAAPARVRAVASLHGANLVGAAPDSPCRLLAGTRAAYLFAIARNDDARSPQDKETLRQAAAAAHRPAEIEVFSADHGWCVLDTPAYNPAAAERAWGRMIELFAAL